MKKVAIIFSLAVLCALCISPMVSADYSSKTHSKMTARADAMGISKYDTKADARSD